MTAACLCDARSARRPAVQVWLAPHPAAKTALLKFNFSMSKSAGLISLSLFSLEILSWWMFSPSGKAHRH